MRKEISPKLVSLAFGILTVSFLAVFAVFAWTEPTVAPPGGNVATPINTGATEQIKSGNLTVNALGVSASGNALLVPNGNVGIGTTAPSNPLSVNGIIESLVGGFKFPNGTVQTIASPEPGSLMGEWWVSGNPLPVCYSDPNCTTEIGTRGADVTINVNNNSVVVAACSFAFNTFWVCGSTDDIYAKCAPGLTYKSTIVHPATAGSMAIVRRICTK